MKNLGDREPPRQCYDNFKLFTTFGVNCGGLCIWLYCSGIRLIRNCTVDVFVGVRAERGYHRHPDSPQFNMNTVQEGGTCTTGLNSANTLSNRGHVLSIPSSTAVNRSAAFIKLNVSIGESCRHCRSIVRHHIDAGFSFFHPDAPRIYRLAQISMNRGWDRDCVTETLHLLKFIESPKQVTNQVINLIYMSLA